jgi:hypothetical protein
MKEEKKEKCACGCDCGCDCACCKPKYGQNGAHGAMGGGFYGLGMIAAAVYFIQQVDGFWPVVVALLKAMVWPVFLLYKVFGMLHM